MLAEQSMQWIFLSVWSISYPPHDHTMNRLYPVFDLDFYLQFKPESVVIAHQVVVPLRYYPRPSIGRERNQEFQRSAMVKSLHEGEPP